MEADHTYVSQSTRWLRVECDFKGSGLETTDPNNNSILIKFDTVYGGVLIKYIVD